MTTRAANDEETALPPLLAIASGSLACTLAAGVIVAAQMPRALTLWPAVALLIVAAALLAACGVMVARLQDFAWHAFFQVWRWAMLAYIGIGGMLEYVFVKDGTPPRVLVMLTLFLVAFALTVPSMLAFSVARFQDR